MNVIITGASLINKGAESMLLITANAVKERFPGSDVYFMTYRDYDEKKYSFKKLCCYPRAVKIALGGFAGMLEKYKLISKIIIKSILRKPYEGSIDLQLEKVLKKTDLVLDISGFAIGEKWNREKHISYITNIRLAQKYNIPVYLLPQSFGPFDYSSDSNMEPIKSQLSQVLMYPKIIFAREQDGFDQLKECFGLSNVKLSYDLVLQNRDFNPANVFTSNPELRIPCVKGEKKVGVVPNIQCFVHGDQKKCLDIYKALISQLIAEGYTVVLFRHSSEDSQICQLIKDEFKNNAQVILELSEFSAMEYNEYIKQFDFIVCSRYHGLVHAYRNKIPCLAFGWAVKYKELTQAVGQEKYFFDITDPNVDIASLTTMLKDMERNCEENKKIIENHLNEIQKNNCFDLVWDDFEKSKGESSE